MSMFPLITTAMQLCLAASSIDSTKATSLNLYYKGQAYGSESQFGNLNVFTNVGFSVIGPMFEGYRPIDIRFKRGFEILDSTITNPGIIKKSYSGWGGFLFSEFVPIVSPVSFPNYTYHMIGEGMLSRKLYEYNMMQGYSSSQSRILSIATVTSAQFLNEIIEAPNTFRGDAVADLLFFNPLGILLFSNDAFAGFFSNSNRNLYYWPGQPVIDVADGAMFNNEESYLYRQTFGQWTKLSLDVQFGLPKMGIGMSYPILDSSRLGMALATQDLPAPVKPYKKKWYAADENLQLSELDTITNHHPFQAAYRLNFDRNGSLLSQLEIGFPRPNVSLNMYPGFASLGGYKLGLYFLIDPKYTSAIAITTNISPIHPTIRR